MKIRIISVGKSSSMCEPLADHYAKMISWPLERKIIPPSKKNNIAQIKSAEATAIKTWLNDKAFLIALDAAGRTFTSENFSQFLAKIQLEAKLVDFVIGGAFGLDQSILAQANLKLSLSPMTLPHQLAHIILLEQIYRSNAILQGHPYHK